jgi:class 3 adenylate cyclase
MIDKWALGLSLDKVTHDEQEYLHARVQETRAKMCEFFAMIGIFVDILLLLVSDAFSHDSALGIISRNSHWLAGIWILLLFGAKSSVSKQRWQIAGSALTEILCCWIILDLLSGGGSISGVDPGFLLSYTILTGAFAVVFAWVPIIGLLAISLPTFVFSWYLPELVDGAPNRYVACTLIALLTVVNHALHLRILKTEIREMRSKISMMPRRMALSLTEVDQLPRERFCVCLSSDWRGYQELVSGMSDEEVVKLLEDYYQRVQNLLVSHLYEYDYYMDWIADELFVVVYSMETDQVNLTARQRMAVKVVEVSQSIIKMKKSFAGDHHIALDIDVGLSSGQSLIGFIGPTNHRKATALGSNPGRARRMQSCGKLLRHQIGEQDRIVFGDEMLLVLQAPDDSSIVINRFDSSSRRLRNLEDQELYFVIPDGELALSKVS